MLQKQQKKSVYLKLTKHLVKSATHNKIKTKLQKNYTVKPRLSNASILDQIGFRPKNNVSDFEHKFGSRPNRKKPSEHERTMMLHMSAFFHTIFGVTELLYFFYCFISNFCKFFQNFSYCTAS